MSTLIIFITGCLILLKNFFLLPPHWDEMYAISKTDRFGEFFVQHNFDPETWRFNEDDHPPTAHFILGAIFRLTGLTALRDKGETIPCGSVFPCDVAISEEAQGYAVESLSFFGGRLVHLIFGLSSLLLIYQILLSRFSIGVSLITTLLIAINPLFGQITPRLFLESPQLFLLLSSFYVLLFCLRSRRWLTRFLLSAVVGFLAALCYLTKINGLVALVAVVFLIIAATIKRMVGKIDGIGMLLAITIAFGAVVIIFLPASWVNPIGFHLNLYRWRQEITLEKMAETPHYSIWNPEKYRWLEFEPVTWGGAIVGVPERVVMMGYRTLIYYDPIKRWLGLPLHLVLLLGAVLGVGRKTKKPVGWALVAWAAGICLSYLGILKLDQARHYYLLLGPLAIILAFGLETYLAWMKLVVSRFLNERKDSF